MPRQIIYFTEETFKRLRRFTEARYGKQRAISITVEQAVKEFLERQNAPDEMGDNSKV